MGEETKDQQLLRRQHEASHKKAKHKPKPKPRPKQAQPSKKPVARAPDEKPQLKPSSAQGTKQVPFSSRAAIRGSEGMEEPEKENPVAVALEYADYAHLALDAVVDGHCTGSSYSVLAEEMAEETTSLWTGPATNGAYAAGATSGLLGMVNVAGGIYQTIRGGQEWSHNKADAVFDISEGVGKTVGGFSQFASMAGVKAAGPVAALVGSAILGVEIGRHGDDQVKEMGWLHDSRGAGVTATDWAADKGQLAEDEVERTTGSHPLGVLAGMDASVIAGIEGGVVAGFAAGNEKVLNIEAYGRERGRSMANFNRAEAYAAQETGYAVRDPLTGQVTLPEPGTNAWQVGAKQYADHDDEQMNAVERAKLLHPERWGESPNSVSMFNHAAEQMYAATHTKGPT